MTQMTFGEAINDAMHVAMAADPKVLAFGLGICDPKAVFGTTAGLQEAFGKDRVFDMPVSENALTGMAVGAAIGGYKPVLVHQRLDFALVSIDQIVNSAAKWFYMFGGQTPVPMVIRMIVGRGWGQGPTHSQALHSWFAHIPGLKVVMPSTAADAKGLLLESIFDPNPVIFIEHRWLHNAIGFVPEGDFRLPIGKANIVRSGKDVTLIAVSLMVPEALRSSEYLSLQGIDCEIIDLRSVRPIDWDIIFSSVEKTGRLVVLDIGHTSVSISSEIVANVCQYCYGSLLARPERIGLPDHAVPTGFSLTDDFYPSARSIAEKVLSLFDKSPDSEWVDDLFPHDIPGKWFSGPF